MAVKGVNIADLRLMPVPFPPILEQAAIGTRAHAALARFGLLSAARASANQSLPQLNQSILAKAFRGELVPQDPNDEPASVLLERIRTERAGSASKAPKRGRKAKAG